MNVTVLEDALAMVEARATPELPWSWSRAELRTRLTRDAMAPWARAARHVVVTHAGEMVARCTAMLPREAADDRGYLGFFDCMDDYDASRQALEAACEWLMSCGVSRVVGPIDLSIWNRYRFMLAGHERPRFAGEPRNPPYYPAAFERFGFRLGPRWHTWDLDRAAVSALLAASAARGRAAAGHTAVLMRRDVFDHEIAKLHDIVCDTFRNNFAFSPVPLALFRDRFAFLRDCLFPGLAFFVEDEAGRVVGFMFGYPDTAAGSRGRVEQVVMFALGLTGTVRRQGLVHGLMVPTFFQAALDLEPQACISALHTEGPTYLDGIAAPTRRYGMFVLAR
jgi:hypothetical protein